MSKYEYSPFSVCNYYVVLLRHERPFKTPVLVWNVMSNVQPILKRQADHFS